jgi:hypothetical protein
VSTTTTTTKGITMILDSIRCAIGHTSYRMPTEHKGNCDKCGERLDRGAMRLKGARRAMGLADVNPYATAVSEFRSEKAGAMAIADPSRRASAVNAARVRFALNVRNVKVG